MLLERSLLSIGKADERYDAVKGIIMGAVEDGTFTYTELLLSDEALYTIAFMVMDGTVFDSGNVARPGTHEVIPSGPLRLVSIDTQEKVDADNAGLAPHQHRKLFTIRDGVWHEPRVAGTSVRGPKVKKTVEYGMDAMIDDSLDQGRQARAMLYRHGWPIRSISGGTGYIVEWRWLEKAAKRGGTAPEDQEIRDLYEQLKARFDTKTKRQNAPQGVGASP